MAADRRPDAREALGRGERGAAALGVGADRQHPLDARLARRRDELLIGRGAGVEVGVGVDHALLGKSGASGVVRAPEPRCANARSPAPPQPSASSSVAVFAGM